MECICLLSAVIIALVVTSVVQLIKCTSLKLIVSKDSVLYKSIYMGMNLEVVILSPSMSVFFCFIRRRIPSRQTALLLRNSIYHLGINALLMAIYCIGTAYNIYSMFCTESQALNSTIAFMWEVLMVLVVGVSVIIQAVLCIKISMDKTNYSLENYAVIDGKDTATKPNF